MALWIAAVAAPHAAFPTDDAPSLVVTAWLEAHCHSGDGSFQSRSRYSVIPAQKGYKLHETAPLVLRGVLLCDDKTARRTDGFNLADTPHQGPVARVHVLPPPCEMQNLSDEQRETLPLDVLVDLSNQMEIHNRHCWTPGQPKP